MCQPLAERSGGEAKLAVAAIMLFWITNQPSLCREQPLEAQQSRSCLARTYSLLCSVLRCVVVGRRNTPEIRQSICTESRRIHCDAKEGDLGTYHHLVEDCSCTRGPLAGVSAGFRCLFRYADLGLHAHYVVEGRFLRTFQR
jgi:hypothetical protein